MKLSPLKPLVMPGVLLAVFLVLATNVTVFDKFDEGAIEAASHLPRSWQPFLDTISHLGDYYLDIVLIIILGTWELIHRHFNRAFISGLTLLSFPFYFIIKETVSRARPTGDFIIARDLPGYSFPSGHAVTSAAAFGLLAILVFSHTKKPWKYLVFSMCLLIIAIIGVSRVYLGAHYPTDVLGGWLLAFIVLSLLRTLSILIASRTTHRISSTTEDEELVED